MSSTTASIMTSVHQRPLPCCHHRFRFSDQTTDYTIGKKSLRSVFLRNIIFVGPSTHHYNSRHYWHALSRATNTLHTLSCAVTHRHAPPLSVTCHHALPRARTRSADVIIFVTSTLLMSSLLTSATRQLAYVSTQQRSHHHR